MTTYKRHGKLWKLEDGLSTEEAVAKIDKLAPSFGVEMEEPKKASIGDLLSTAWRQGGAEFPTRAAALLMSAHPLSVTDAVLRERGWMPEGKMLPNPRGYLERLADSMAPKKEVAEAVEKEYPTALPLLRSVAEIPTYALAASTGTAVAPAASSAALGAFSGAIGGGARAYDKGLLQSIKTQGLETVGGWAFGKVFKALGLDLSNADKETLAMFKKYNGMKFQDVPDEVISKFDSEPALQFKSTTAEAYKQIAEPTVVAPEVPIDFRSRTAIGIKGTPTQQMPEKQAGIILLQSGTREQNPLLKGARTDILLPDNIPSGDRTSVPRLPPASGKPTIGGELMPDGTIRPIQDAVDPSAIELPQFMPRGDVSNVPRLPPASGKPIIGRLVSQMTPEERLLKTPDGNPATKIIDKIYKIVPELDERGLTPEQKAGLITPDDLAEIGNYGASKEAQIETPRFIAQRQSGKDIMDGVYTGVIEDKILNPTQERVALKYEDAAALATGAKEIAKEFGFYNKIQRGINAVKARPVLDALRTTKNEHLRDLKIDELQKIYPNFKRNHLLGAQKIRLWMDNLRQRANEVRALYGRDPIGERESYAPLVDEMSLWNKLRSSSDTVDNFMEFTLPNAKANPRAFQRLRESSPDQINDLGKLLDIYLDNMLNDIHMLPAIEHVKANTRILAEAGKTGVADIWNQFAKVSLGGKPGSIDAALGVIAGTKKHAILQKWANMRVKSALVANLSWMTGLQPTSGILLSGKMTGYKNTILGAVDYFTNKQVREAVNRSTSMRIKTKGMATYANKGITDMVNRTSRTYGDTAADILGAGSNFLEKHLQGTAISAGYRQGRKLGMKGVDLDNYANMVGERIHSMYNRESRALISNNLTTRFLVPFQSFAIEASQHLKDLGLNTLTKSHKERAKMAAYLVSGVWLARNYEQAVRGRKSTNFGTFIPFVGSVVQSGINTVMGSKNIDDRSVIAPVEDINQMSKAVADFIHKGNTRKLRQQLVFWGMGQLGGGGTQMNRIIDGLESSYRGYHTSDDGKPLFPVRGAREVSRSLFLGPWGTEAGRKYLKKKGIE